MILDYLVQEATAFGVTATQPLEAVRAGVKLLEDTGAVTGEYIDDILAGYEKYGPYFVLTPGFAMPHAQPSGKCSRAAISFMTLAQPVAFGHETNDPVRYVMALCGTDHDSHRQLLRDLMKFLSNEAILEALPTMQSFSELKKIIEEEGI